MSNPKTTDAPTLKEPVRIQPTVGRVVLFHPGATPPAGFSMPAEAGEPCDAHICHVNDDDTLNLAVFDAVGAHHAITNVPLSQNGEAPADRPYCTWMPYQRGQAAKYDRREEEFAKQQQQREEDEAVKRRTVQEEALLRGAGGPGTSKTAQELEAEANHQGHTTEEQAVLNDQAAGQSRPAGATRSAK